MKKQFLAFIAAGSLLAACNSGTESSTASSDSTAKVNTLMSTPEGGDDAAGGGGAPGSAPTTTNASWMPKDQAQALINNYDNNTLNNFSTKYYLADLQLLKEYVDYAIAEQGKDAQLIFGRDADGGQVHIIITAVRPDGTHILYNDGAVPSVLEHCLPCPPGTDCYTSTNLSQ